MLKTFMYRSASRANCSPVLGVLAFLVAMGITIYIYRDAIVHAIIIAGEATGIVCGSAILISITFNTVMWYRRRAKAAQDAQAVPASSPSRFMDGLHYHGVSPASAGPGKSPLVPTTIDAEEAITAEADWLAAEGVELAFSPDGKTLKAKEG